ncbi:MAG: hypothetical protein L0Z62_00840 [Gemmataceae bacterium]|nr:hypothetical protein [Gemmataceae bacterium]
MDDFSQYAQMRDSGVSPRDVYLAAGADGLDDLTRLRLLRRVFGLSLKEAKQVSGAAEALDRKQEVKPGATVYWAGWDSQEGTYLMEAQVQRIDEGCAELTGHKKYLLADGGLTAVPFSGEGQTRLQVAALEKSLGELLGELVQFLGGLAAVNGKPASQPEREKV